MQTSKLNYSEYEGQFLNVGSMMPTDNLSKKEMLIQYLAALPIDDSLKHNINTIMHTSKTMRDILYNQKMAPFTSGWQDFALNQLSILTKYGVVGAVVAKNYPTTPTEPDPLSPYISERYWDFPDRQEGKMYIELLNVCSNPCYHWLCFTKNTIFSVGLLNAIYMLYISKAEIPGYKEDSNLIESLHKCYEHTIVNYKRKPEIYHIKAGEIWEKMSKYKAAFTTKKYIGDFRTVSKEYTNI